MKRLKRPHDDQMLSALCSLGIITAPVQRELAKQWKPTEETVCEVMDRLGLWPLGGVVGAVAERLAKEDRDWRFIQECKESGF